MGARAKLRASVLLVSVIQTMRRCGCEHFLRSCSCNVESMKAALHWKLLFLVSTDALLGCQVVEQPVQNVSENQHRVSCSFIPEKVNVVFCTAAAQALKTNLLDVTMEAVAE